MFPTYPKTDPAWVRELGLDRERLHRVREDVHSMRLNDGHPGALSEEGTPAGDARRMRRMVGRRWRPLDLVVPGILLVAGFGLPMIADRPTGSLALIVPIAPQLGLTLAIVVAAFQHLWGGGRTPYYALALRKHGIVVCPRCGYRAAGDTETTTCSECGFDDPFPRPKA